MSMKQKIGLAQRALDPRRIALRLMEAALRRPLVWRQVKALTSRFPVLERRLKARIFALPATSELFGAAHQVPAEPVCDRARWLHAHLESLRVEGR